jgi:GNAT superfamily N-acetyltransferase
MGREGRETASHPSIGSSDQGPPSNAEHAAIVDGASALEEVRELFREYAESLAIDLSFQRFEAELAELPGEYAAPYGRLLLAVVDGPAGCVGLRGGSAGDCEMKRLFVRPCYRKAGVGRALVAAIIAEARSIGYRRILLDTLPGMAAAQALYRSFGFVDCPAYTYNPVEGARFMRLDLGRGEGTGRRLKGTSAEWAEAEPG